VAILIIRATQVILRYSQNEHVMPDKTMSPVVFSGYGAKAFAALQGRTLKDWLREAITAIRGMKLTPLKVWLPSLRHGDNIAGSLFEIRGKRARGRNPINRERRRAWALLIRISGQS
jgi:hypothetical protein